MENRRVIRLEFYQQRAQYRVPRSSGRSIETYYLPPPSTVIGMIHAACGFDSYVDMDVSIQGRSAGKMIDLQKQIGFPVALLQWKKEMGGLKEAEYAFGWRRSLDDKLVGIKSGPAQVECISDISLLIHIDVKDEKYREIVLLGLQNPRNYLSLGRYEDLVVIENVELVDCFYQEKEIEIEQAENMTYVPTKMLQDGLFSSFHGGDSGTRYRLGKKYELKPTTMIDSGKVDVVRYNRVWELVDVVLVRGCYSQDAVLCDGYGDYLLFV